MIFGILDQLTTYFLTESICSLKGTKEVNADGHCICKQGFIGEICDVCANGYYGNDCEKCNHGFYRFNDSCRG